ncbi:MAG: hypothetical protein ACEQR8_00925 [Cypionkella sp.]
MSRRAGRALALALAMVAAPALAQSAPASVTADQAIAAAREAYGPPDSRARPACPPQAPGGEIVVCGEVEDPSQFHVRSSSELDPTRAGARDNVPRAPDVGTVYPGVVVARGCFIPPCPPPMAKIIDLKAIPEAPPGSDADRVARGLAPTGRDEPAGEGEPVRPAGSAAPAAPR